MKTALAFLLILDSIVTYMAFIGGYPVIGMIGIGFNLLIVIALLIMMINERNKDKKEEEKSDYRKY